MAIPFTLNAFPRKLLKVKRLKKYFFTYFVYTCWRRILQVYNSDHAIGENANIYTYNQTKQIYV